MFKVMTLLSRKPGLSHAEFVDYYETRHAKLIWKTFPWIVDYRRNFIDLTGAILGQDAAPPDFDAITEIWFADRAGYDRMLAVHAAPETGPAVSDDEDNFLDRSKIRFFIVDERGADPGR
jgi:hypothetical protein